jgi:hypothetical protein
MDSHNGDPVSLKFQLPVYVPDLLEDDRGIPRVSGFNIQDEHAVGKGGSSLGDFRKNLQR